MRRILPTKVEHLNENQTYLYHEGNWYVCALPAIIRWIDIPVYIEDFDGKIWPYGHLEL